jgi:hypothetical protein
MKRIIILFISFWLLPIVLAEIIFTPIEADVAIFNQTHFKQGLNGTRLSPDLPQAEKLLLYYDFDEGTGDVAYDLGINDNLATLTSGAAYTDIGRYYTSINFSGDNDYLSVPRDNLDNFAEWTMLVWMKPSVLQTGTIIDFMGSDLTVRLVNPASLPRVDVDYHPTDKSGDGLNCDGNGFESGSIDYAIGAWQLLWVRVNNTHCQWGLNTTYSGREAGYGNVTFNSDTPRIGSKTNNLNYYDGLMDEFMFYNTSLSLAEITDIYDLTKGRYLVGDYQSEVIVLKNISQQVNNVSWVSTETSTANISVKVRTNDAGNLTGLIRYLGFEGDNEEDSELNDYTGSNPTGASWANSLHLSKTNFCRFEQCYGGDGTDSNQDSIYYIDDGDMDLDFPAEDFTVSIWYRNNDTAEKALIYKEDALRLRVFSGGFRCMLNSNTSEQATWSSGYTANNEQLISCTYDGSTIRLYINGTEKATRASTPMHSNNNDVSIGWLYNEGGSKGQYINGYIDEVMIFNRTLSADELLDIYNENVATWTAYTERNFTNPTIYPLNRVNGTFVQAKFVLQSGTKNETATLSNFSIGHNSTLVGALSAADTCTFPAINLNHVITDVCVKSNEIIDMGTGNLTITDGGRLVCEDTNLTTNIISINGSNALNLSFTVSGTRLNISGLAK